jgi:hypothetical protein
MAARNYQIIYGGRIMVEKALLDLSSDKYIALSLDGVPLKGAIRIDKIRNIGKPDTAKEIDVTILAKEVLVKKLDGEVVDISEA